MSKNENDGEKDILPITQPSSFQRELEEVVKEESGKVYPDPMDLVRVDVVPDGLPMQQDVENLMNLFRIMQKIRPHGLVKLRNSIKRRQPKLWDAVTLYLEVTSALACISFQASRQERKQLSAEWERQHSMIERASSRAQSKVREQMEELLGDGYFDVIDVEEK